MACNGGLVSSNADNRIIRYKNCKVLRGGILEESDVWVRNGCVIDPMMVFFKERVLANVTINCNGLIASPGFIDLQVNGAFGIDFSSFATTQEVTEGINKVSKQLLQYGVTSFCPTLVTSSFEYYNMVMGALNRRKGGISGAAILGVHAEGPFINRTKKGAHAEVHVQDTVSYSLIQECYGSLDNMRIITIAPELPGAMEVIPLLVKKRIVVALGHSSSNLTQAEDAINNGATLITHLFNAMLPFHHRDPGIVGLLTSLRCNRQQVYYSLISDGLHTHETVQRIAERSNPEGVVLITDSMAAMGLCEGIHKLGNITVEVKDSRTSVAGTDILAGSLTLTHNSIAKMDECVRIFQKATDCSISSALEAASLHPAQVLGETQKGRLDIGCDADIVLLSNDLTVHGTVIAGEIVWKSENSLLIKE